MDAKVAFWAGALVNMAVMLVFGVAGVRRVRRGDIAGHRRAMLAAASLVLAFLLAYGVKLRVLGREDFSLWSSTDLWVLRFHETCVAVMLVAGAFALGCAWRMRRSATVTGDATAVPASQRTRAWHRRAGRAAATAAALGFLSAGLVLIGMIGRAGG